MNGSFQQRVGAWMLQCFNPEIAADRVERGDRLLEETFELLQWLGYDPSRIEPVRDYVWGRPVGEGPQEVGGVGVCLAALCNACGINLNESVETELARILDPEIMERIRVKQAAKPSMSPLPCEPPSFQDELAALINRHSLEGGSNTPDFLLAEFLAGCLRTFDDTVGARARWHGATPVEGTDHPMTETGAVLQRDVEGWSPETAANLVKYAQAFGVTLEELAQMSDPRLWKLLHRVYLADQPEAGARGDAQSERPGPLVMGAGRPVRDELATREWMRRRNDQKLAGR